MKAQKLVIGENLLQFFGEVKLRQK